MLVKRAVWVGEEEIVGFGRVAPGPLGSDTETTGVDPWGTMGVDRQHAPDRPFMFTFCDSDGNYSHVRLPVNARTREVRMTSRAKEALETYYADERIVKTFHNAPFDRRMIRASGLRLRGKVHCTQIRMHTIRPNELSFKLKPLCKKYLNILMDDEQALRASVIAARRAAKSKGWAVAEDVEADYWLGDPELCLRYGLTDAKRAVALHLAQDEYFKQKEALREVYRGEQELMRVVAAMEDKGIRLDEQRMAELRRFYQAIVDDHASIIETEMAGVNPRSPKQMTRFWFDERGHKPIKYSRNKKKGNAPVACQHCKGHGCRVCQDTGQNPKCDGDFLKHIGVKRERGPDGEERLVPGDKLAWAILHHGAAQSMLDFVNQYAQLAVRDLVGNLILHPNYKQTGARTARMSCENPNLQNVASDESGKKRVDVPYRIREAFVPREGKVFYIPDYSQIEVWVLALRSGDKDLIAALAAGGDAHQNVADLIWGHTYDKEMAKRDKKLDPDTLKPHRLANLKRFNSARKRAKNLQFCKIYGGGVAKIAEMIGCSYEEAEIFVAEYDARLPGVARFMEQRIREAERTGEIVNPFGRVYPIDEGFEYRATNYDIQGTAAEIMKRAMLRVFRLTQLPQWKGNVDLLLQIHDELVIEVDRKTHEQHGPELMREIVVAMAADYEKLNSPVPFPVGFKIAEERWSSSMEVDVDMEAAA